MLDVLRKHARSWLIKVILGAIIITFVFFFGYSSYRKGMRGGRSGATGDIAIKVNGIPISFQEFELFLVRNLEQIKSSFRDKEVPDFARKIAQSTTFEQLVRREVALQEADELGLKITDLNLAQVIRQSQSSKEGQEFDPIAYRHRFLPYFKNRYGLDYEQFVRQDLRLSALASLLEDLGPEAPFGGDDKAGTTKWTFEVVTLDPKALVESKAIGTEEEAKTQADKLARSDPRHWAKLLRHLKVTPQKIGPIVLRARRQLMGGSGTIEDYTKIFALDKDHPVIGTPIERDSKFYVVRLIEKTETQDKDAPTPPTGDFFETWISKLANKAKVQSFLEKN